MRSKWIGAFLGGTAIVVAAASVSPASASAASPLGQYARQKPAWQRCDPRAPADLVCAKIKVPLDYGRPGEETIELAVSRMKARESGKRHGVLLMNPGGPGDSGRFMPFTLKLPDSVRDRFDLIGFDPRGMWSSAPVRCGLTEAEDERRHPYDPRTFAQNVAWARTVAEECRTKHGARLPHITTRNTARDMDVIRSVLGEKKISYLGVSYGTYLGAVYTQMFPDRTDRFILDSAIDPNRVWREYIRGEAHHAERAFRRWSEWTAQRNAAYRLGDTPAKVRKAFWDLVAQADRTPIKDDGETYTGADIRNFAGFSMVREAAENIVRWKKAASTPLPATDSPALVDDLVAGYWSIVCGDADTWPRDPAQYRRDAARDKARYPLVGDLTAGITPCAFWTKGSEPRTVVDNDTPALILQYEWDDSTPLPGAMGLRKAMKGARMVTVAGGEGHGVYANPHPPCVDQAVTTYLTTGRLPTGDVTCQASDTPPQPTADHADQHAAGGAGRPAVTPTASRTETGKNAENHSTGGNLATTGDNGSIPYAAAGAAALTLGIMAMTATGRRKARAKAATESSP